MSDIIFKTRENDYYLDPNGKLRRRPAPENKHLSLTDFNAGIYDTLHAAGYVTKNIYTITNLMDRLLGLQWDIALERLRESGTHLQMVNADTKRRSEYTRRMESDYSDLLSGDGTHIIFVGKLDFDFRPLDFTVTLLLSTGRYEDQVAFVTEKKNRIAAFAMENMALDKRRMEKIGSFGFYDLSDITVTRSSEVELLFSLKSSLIDTE